MGDVKPIDDSFVEAKMKDDNGKEVPVVKIKFRMNTSVENSLYDYLVQI
jgi:hypothetical protein